MFQEPFYIISSLAGQLHVEDPVQEVEARGRDGGDTSSKTGVWNHHLKKKDYKKSKKYNYFW